MSLRVYFTVGRSFTYKWYTTGASGVLGTAVFNAFKSAQHDVLGLAHSRTQGDLKKLDLLDDLSVDKLFSEFRPNCEASAAFCSASRPVTKQY